MVEPYRFRSWVLLVLKHSLFRVGHGEGVGVVTLAAMQSVFLWVLVAFFGASAVSALFLNLTATWPMATGGALAFMLFVVAPFQLWREEATRADTADDLLVPSISCDPVTRKVGRSIMGYLRVTAEGGRSLAGCSVELLAVYRDDGGRWERIESVTPCLLKWSPAYGGAGEALHSFSGNAEVEVFERSGVTPRGALFVRSVDTGDRHIQECRVIPEHARLLIEVEVAADHAESTRRVLEVMIDPLGLRPTRDSYGATGSAPLPTIRFLDVPTEALSQNTPKRLRP